jgi:hypothetical protein
MTLCAFNVAKLLSAYSEIFLMVSPNDRVKNDPAGSFVCL